MVRGTKIKLWKERVPLGVHTGKKSSDFGRARGVAVYNLCSGGKGRWKRNDVAKGPRPPRGSMV